MSAPDEGLVSKSAPAQPVKAGLYRVALYPGTFDPITNGHLDIIERASKLVDKLVIGVAINEDKRPLFSLDERLEMVRTEVGSAVGATSIEVRAFDTLLVKFAAAVGASLIVRGLRAVSDFEYEFQMAGMNRKLYPDVETLFLTPAEQYMFISATMVREIASLGGDVSPFVNPSVIPRMKSRLARG